MEVGGYGHTLAALPPGMIHYPLYRRLVGHDVRSERLRKIRPYWDSIPGPSNPLRVAIPTELTTEQENTGETNCIMRSVIARRKVDMESLKGKDHLENVNVDGKIR